MILLLLSQALPPPVPMGKRFQVYTEHSDPAMTSDPSQRWATALQPDVEADPGHSRYLW